MKETRGLYRKMLLQAGIFKDAESADRECTVTMLSSVTSVAIVRMAFPWSSDLIHLISSFP